MNNTIGTLLLLAFAVMIIVVSVCQPSILSDQNAFLHDFVGHEYLSILGVIVAITAASASSIHLELRRLEVEYKQKKCVFLD